MDTATLLFFEQQPAALPLYEAFADAVIRQYPDTKVKVQKSQISFSNRYMFACVSFARVKKKKELPDPYLSSRWVCHTRWNLPAWLSKQSHIRGGGPRISYWGMRRRLTGSC